MIILANLFSYNFMIHALIIGVVIATNLALVGVWMNLRHLALSGDAMSHASLAGIAIGLACGLNTTVMACLLAIIGGLVVEIISQKMRAHQDMALAIVLSVALAIAGIAASYPEGRNLEGYLFGSILAITNMDIILSLILCIVIVVLFLTKYQTLAFIMAEPESAQVQGINVKAYSYLMTILSSLTIACASRIVGVLVVTSVLVLPVATAFQTAKSFKGLIIQSMIMALIATLTGIILAWYIPWNPGSLIVLVEFIIFIVFFIAKKRPL